MRKVLRTCGVDLDAVGPVAAAATIIAAGVEGRPAAVHLCNAYTLSLALRDDAVRDVLAVGDHNFMDGAPLVWAARRNGMPELEGRVYGPNLMEDVLDQGRDVGLRHFLYGSSPDVLADLEIAIATTWPGATVAGSHSPPFRDLTEQEADEAVTMIKESGAQVVWVGLGTPRQDHFVAAFRDRIGIPLIAVGAAFDFHAGRKAQAPLWMQNAGLEWLFRLVTEPRRLWRRYLVGNPVFLWGLSRGVEVVELP